MFAWLSALVARLRFGLGGGSGALARLPVVAEVPGPTRPILPGSRPRLLLVEDDWPTHSSLRRIFTRQGWEVDSASTVSGALAMLELHPRAMILDLLLADGVGLEILRKVRADRVAIRIVVTTGSTNGALRDEVERLTPDAWIPKPIDVDDLLEALGVTPG